MKAPKIIYAVLLLWIGFISHGISTTCSQVSVTTQDDIDRVGCIEVGNLNITNAQGNLTFPGLQTVDHYLTLEGDNNELVSLSFPDLQNVYSLTISWAANLVNISIPQLNNATMGLDIQGCPSVAVIDVGQLSPSRLDLEDMGNTAMQGSIHDGVAGQSVFYLPEATDGNIFFKNISWEGNCFTAPKLTSLTNLDVSDTQCIADFGNVTSITSGSFYGTVSFGAFTSLQTMSILYLVSGMIPFSAPALTTVDTTLDISDLHSLENEFNAKVLDTVGDLSIHYMQEQLLPGNWPSLHTAKSITLEGNITTDNDYNMFPSLQVVEINMTFRPTNQDFDCAAASAKYSSSRLPSVNDVICYWPNGTIYEASSNSTPPSPSQTTSSSSSGGISKGGLIAVGVMAGVVALILFGLAIFFTTRRWSSRGNKGGSTKCGTEDSAVGPNEEKEVRPATEREEAEGREVVEVGGRDMIMPLGGNERFEAPDVTSPRSELHSDCVPVEAPEASPTFK